MPKSSNKPKSKNKILISCILIFILIVCCFISLASLYVYKITRTIQPEEVKRYETLNELEFDNLLNKVGLTKKSTRTVKLSPEEFTQLFNHMNFSGRSDTVYWFDITEDNKFETYYYTPPVKSTSYSDTENYYLEVHTIADLEIKNGQFINFIIEEMSISDINFTLLLKGKNLSDYLNTSLSEVMVLYPDAEIGSIETLYVENGKFVLKVKPDFYNSDQSNPN